LTDLTCASAYISRLATVGNLLTYFSQLLQTVHEDTCLSSAEVTFVVNDHRNPVPSPPEHCIICSADKSSAKRPQSARLPVDCISR